MTESWGQFKTFDGAKFKNLAPEFTQKISRLLGGQLLTSCFQCSKCSAGCPVGDKVNIQIHEVMRMLLFGLEEVLQTDMIWLCTTCYTCQERCPQTIEITDILFGLKNIAYKKGMAPAGYVAAAKSLYDTGRLYAPTEWEREDLGLDEVPELNVEDTKKLFKATKLLKLQEGK